MTAACNRRDALGLLSLPALWALWPTSASAQADDVSDFLSPDYAQRERTRREASDVLSVDLENLLPGLELGWLVPPNLFVSTEKRAKWEYIYPLEFGFRTAAFSRSLPAKDVERMALSYPDALCDPGQEWFAYRAPNAVRIHTKVFALPARPAKATLGMYRGAVPPAVVARDFQATTEALDIRSLGLLSAKKSHRYAEYAGYDNATGEVRRISIVLYDKDWKLIARQDDEFAEGETWCVDCRTPTLSDGLHLVFGTFNMMALPDYPYPLLLSDRSSVETRTLTLSTFLGDGRFARAGRYQIFSGCPSLEALIKSTQ
jgi:hypothetical protein